MENIYNQNDFANRAEYLQHLSILYDVDIETIETLADLLGPSEDFDGLVSSLEDYS